MQERSSRWVTRSLSCYGLKKGERQLCTSGEDGDKLPQQISFTCELMVTVRTLWHFELWSLIFFRIYIANLPDHTRADAQGSKHYCSRLLPIRRVVLLRTVETTTWRPNPLRVRNFPRTTHTIYLPCLNVTATLPCGNRRKTPWRDGEIASG